MELALRQAYGLWGHLGGMGQSGEVGEEGGGLPGGAVDFSSGEVDPSTYYPAPGYNIGTTPGVELTPTELAAEQARARTWLSQLNLPSAVTAGAKVALTAAQIASGLQAGTVKASSTCPGGYLVSGTGQCVQASSATSAQLLSGISNQTLAIVGIAFVALMMLGGGGGRRR
jgi:hypothetical protein